MSIEVDRVVNFRKPTEGREGRNFVVSVSMVTTDKQDFEPKGYVVIMKLLEIMPDSSQRLLELIDNQGKELHFHDKEPNDHSSRVVIVNEFENTTEVINFFQERVQKHVR